MEVSIIKVPLKMVDLHNIICMVQKVTRNKVVFYLKSFVWSVVELKQSNFDFVER